MLISLLSAFQRLGVVIVAHDAVSAGFGPSLRQSAIMCSPVFPDQLCVSTSECAGDTSAPTTVRSALKALTPGCIVTWEDQPLVQLNAELNVVCLIFGSSL